MEDFENQLIGEAEDDTEAKGKEKRRDSLNEMAASSLKSETDS